MSDAWYRDPVTIPPYEDGFGNLWTIDGVCLNPVHTCEPPEWVNELALVNLQAEVVMGFQEAIDRQMRELMNALTWPRAHPDTNPNEEE